MLAELFPVVVDGGVGVVVVLPIGDWWLGGWWRGQWELFWLVDGVDGYVSGTSYYVKGNGSVRFDASIEMNGGFCGESFKVSVYDKEVNV